MAYKFNSGSVVFSSASSVTALGQPLEVTGYVSSSLGYQGLLTDADRDTYITTEETDDEDKIKFYTGGNLRMMMRKYDESVMITDNNVGEFTPQALLHISGAGAGGDQLFIVGGGGAGTYYPNALVVDQNGHVGIGSWGKTQATANPLHTLDVSGGICQTVIGPGTSCNFLQKFSSSASSIQGQTIWTIGPENFGGDAQQWKIKVSGATQGSSEVFSIITSETQQPPNHCIFVAVNGEVGIGTSGVDEKLHVQTSSANCRIRLETDDGYDVGILGYQASTQKLGLIYDDSDDVVTFSYGTATNNHFVIDATGSIGLGTKAPAVGLTIYDGGDLVANRQNLTLQTSQNTASQGIAFRNSGGSYTWNIYRADAGSNNASLRIAGGAYNETIEDLTDYVTYLHTGEVGIGITAPTHKLTVVGAVSGSSTLEAVGATILGSTLNVTGAATMAGKVSVDNEISGSGTLQAAGATTLGSTLSVSGNVGIGVDAGSDELHVSGATGAIIIESNAASIASLQLQQGGTTYGRLQIGGGGVFNIENLVADEDMVFKVNDGGSTRTALTIDSSVSEVIVNNGADSLVDFRVEGATEDHLLFVDGSADLIGIKTDSPKVALDVHHNPTGLSDDTGGGDVAVWGAEDGTETLAAGKLMYLNTSGVWKYADADAVSTSGGVLLAIALGTSISDGLLLRGYFDAATIQGSFVKGGVCYVSETAGVIDFTRPSASGDTVRVVGYGTNTANVIYFNPSGDWIEL